MIAHGGVLMHARDGRVYHLDGRIMSGGVASNGSLFGLELVGATTQLVGFLEVMCRNAIICGPAEIANDAMLDIVHELKDVGGIVAAVRHLAHGGKDPAYPDQPGDLVPARAQAADAQAARAALLAVRPFSSRHYVFVSSSGSFSGLIKCDMSTVSLCTGFSLLTDGSWLSIAAIIFGVIPFSSAARWANDLYFEDHFHIEKRRTADDFKRDIKAKKERDTAPEYFDAFSFLQPVG